MKSLARRQRGPVKDAFRYFPLLAVAPRQFAQWDLQRIERALRSGQALSPRDSAAAADILGRLQEGKTGDAALGTDQRSNGKLLKTARDRYMAMDYALRTLEGKAAAALAEVGIGWNESESVVEEALRLWLDIARQAVAEYLDAGIPRDEVLDDLQHTTSLARDRLLEWRTVRRPAVWREQT